MWQNEPFAIDVKKGETIAFCRCNKSAKGPYCDGSHKGSGQTPYVETFPKNTTVWACGCQKSANRPYCDGSHSKK